MVNRMIKGHHPQEPYYTFRYITGFLMLMLCCMYISWEACELGPR